MTAKEYLKQARHLDERIKTKIAEKAALHDLARKATMTPNDMPGSPNCNTHRMEDNIVKIVMLENDINEDIARLIDLKQEIIGVIASVADEECRLVLEKRYINYEWWEDIAASLCTGIKNIYRIHNKALKQVVLPEKYYNNGEE